MNNKKNYRSPDDVEELREELKNDNTKLAITDLGAGSRTAAVKERTVRDIVCSAVKPKKYGEMLYRLAAHYQPATVIELGTSLGITTSYLSLRL